MHSTQFTNLWRVVLAQTPNGRKLVFNNFHVFLIFFMFLVKFDVIDAYGLNYGYNYAYSPGIGGAYGQTGACIDNRRDCHFFDHLCEEPGYETYMNSCCCRTCSDIKGGRRGRNRGRYRDRYSDEDRNQDRPWQRDNRRFRDRRYRDTTRRNYRDYTDYGGFGEETPELAKWKDDNRWDRNQDVNFRRNFRNGRRNRDDSDISDISRFDRRRPFRGRRF